MRKALFILLLLVVSMSASAQDEKVELTLTSNPVIQAALDSICIEGYNLYNAEFVNWVSTDSLLAHCDTDDIGGNLIWQPTDSTWSAMFYDKKKENCIFELQFNIKNGNEVFSYDKRPITETEKPVIELKNKMFNNAIEQYGDSMSYNPDYGRPNFDFVRINDNTTRMYMLQGIERHNIIPFGNDLSIDFDNQGNPTAFRRYHRSLIASPNDGETTFHSHLKDNPYITPTDVCNFILYHGNMKQTYILSTALDGYILYDLDSNSALFIPREAMNKIVNSSQKR